MIWWLGACVAVTPTPTGSKGSETGASTTPATDTPLRVATWNIERLGAAGSDEHTAAREVLVRIDADVVGLQEIGEGEEDALLALALDLGYDVVQPRTNPFGTDHNAVLSRLPVEVSSFPSSAVLSADPDANDVTRWPVSVALIAPWGEVVGVTTQHCKSGFDLADAFRRSIDTLRLGQATRRIEAERFVAMGDVNASLPELDDAPPSPARWTFAPGGMPSDFVLGDDVAAIMDDGGLANHPFALLGEIGLTAVEARQPDGREAARDSGRLIDYVLVDDGLRATASEIYDSRDEGFDPGVEKAGEALARDVSRRASDHLPVVVDVRPR